MGAVWIPLVCSTPSITPGGMLQSGGKGEEAAVGVHCRLSWLRPCLAVMLVPVQACTGCFGV